MSIMVTVDSATEPISLLEAKEHLNVTSDSDDTYILSLISVARRSVEVMTQRSLVTKTLKLSLDSFGDSRELQLPMSNIQTVTSVKYYDEAGTLQTFSANSYWVDTSSSPGRICLRFGESWPIPQSDRPNSVIIEYDAGYGDKAQVPSELKHAIKLLIGHWYANREDVASVPYPHAQVPKAAEFLVMPYRVWS